MKTKLVLVAMLAFGAILVAAQPAPANTWGLTVDSLLLEGTRLGAVIHATPNLVFSPGLFVDFRSFTNEDKVTNTELSSSGNSGPDDNDPVVRVDIGVDYLFQPEERVTLYAGGVLAFGYGSYSDDLSGLGAPTGDPVSDDNTNFEVVFGPRLGGRFMITERFGLYAHAGLYLEFDRVNIKETDETASVVNTDEVDTLFSVGTAVTPIGVVFYF